MNLYLRYFDNEVVVENFEDAIAFLRTIPDVNVDKKLEDDLYDYYTSDIPYPKRYKTRQRAYFIVIKTVAKTMAEFKANAHKPQPKTEEMPSEKDYQQMLLNKRQPGWYEVSMTFRRVLFDEQRGKCAYRDANIVVRLKGMSQHDCYERLVDYLEHRDDIDPRSQFPSARSQNVQFTYLGLEFPTEAPASAGV